MSAFAKKRQSQSNRTSSVTLFVLYLSIIHLVDTQFYIGQSVHGVTTPWRGTSVSERETALFEYGRK